MKNVVILSILFVFISTILVAQSSIPLTDNMVFYTNEKGVSVRELRDTLIKTVFGTAVRSRNFVLENSSFSGCFISNCTAQNGLDELFRVGSENADNNTLYGGKSADTLFVNFDDDYWFSDYMPPEIYLMGKVNSENVHVPVWIDHTHGYFAIDNDTVDIAGVLFTGNDISMVFEYSYVFDHTDTIFLSAAQATHPVIIDPKTENGNSLANLMGSYSKRFSIMIGLNNGGNFLSDWSWSGYASITTSDYFKGNIKLYFGSSLINIRQGNYPSYLIEYPILDSIVDSVYFTNNPDSLVNSVVNIGYYHKRENNKILLGDFTKYYSWTGNFAINGMMMQRTFAAEPFWQGSIHLSMQNNSDFGYVMQHYTEYINNGMGYDYIASPYYEEFNDSITDFYGLQPYSDIHYGSNGDTLFLGEGPLFFWPVWTNTSGVVHSESEVMGMWGNYFYPSNSSNSYVFEDLQGNIITEGNGVSVYVSGLSHQKYVITQTNDYTHFKGLQGKSLLKSYIDLKEKDYTPPVASKIYLINGSNTMKYEFDNAEQVVLKFSAGDFVTYTGWHNGIGYKPLSDSATEVYIRVHNSDKWISAQWDKVFCDSAIGSVFQSNLTDLLDNDSAMYDLKIKIYDTSLNASEYIFLPAFIYGDYIVGSNEHKQNNYKKVALWPNPAVNCVNVNGIEANTEFKIISIDGKLVMAGKLKNSTIDVESLFPGAYIIVFNNDLGKGVSLKFVKYF